MRQFNIFALGGGLIAAILVGWALLPFCLGSLCVGIRQDTSATQPAGPVETGPAFETTDASSGTAPVESANEEASDLPLTDDVVSELETNITSSLESTSAETTSLETSAESGDANSDDDTPGKSEAVDLDGSAAPNYQQRLLQQAAKARQKTSWDQLVDTALHEPDEERRGEAINSIALHRNEASVQVLADVAYFDPDPGNRLQAIQQLWYSAADGLDQDGEIRRTLEAALSDPDDDIATMAAQALTDLQALDDARSED